MDSARRVLTSGTYNAGRYAGVVSSDTEQEADEDSLEDLITSDPDLQGRDGGTEDADDSNDGDEGETINVWENLQDIFADMDAQEDSDESDEMLREPLSRMRRLLEIHHQLSNKELEIRAVHFGMILEREWYLRKLRALEGRENLR